MDNRKILTIKRNWQQDEYNRYQAWVI